MGGEPELIRGLEDGNGSVMPAVLCRIGRFGPFNGGSGLDPDSFGLVDELVRRRYLDHRFLERKDGRLVAITDSEG